GTAWRALPSFGRADGADRYRLARERPPPGYWAIALAAPLLRAQQAGLCGRSRVNSDDIGAVMTSGRIGMTTRIRSDIESLLAQAGFPLVVEQDGNTIVLSGMVENEEERAAALEVAWANWDARLVEDNIEVAGLLSATTAGYQLSESEAGGFDGADE